MSAERAVAALLAALPGPSDDPEVQRTPERVAELWQTQLLDGYAHDPAEALGRPIPEAPGGLVVVTDLPFHTVCPHHLTPAFGVVHIAYESGGQVVGFGALQRLVDTLAHRLVLQEQLTRQLAEALMQHLDARGAAVQVEARHLCMILQGRTPQQARVTTRCALGSLDGRGDVLPPVSR